MEEHGRRLEQTISTKTFGIRYLLPRTLSNITLPERHLMPEALPIIIQLDGVNTRPAVFLLDTSKLRLLGGHSHGSVSSCLDLSAPLTPLVMEQNEWWTHTQKRRCGSKAEVRGGCNLFVGFFYGDSLVVSPCSGQS